MAKKYQRCPSELAAAAWGRGHITPLELFRVAAWKTGQGLGSLTVNTEEEIQDRTRAALDAIRPWRDQSVSGLTSEATWANWRETARQAIGDAAVNSGLLGLDGVGYPMATAILAILEPTVWPVLDRWATLTVFGPRSAGGVRPNRHWQHAAAYEAYARHLAVHGAAVWGADLSVHQLDQRAMNLAKGGAALPQGWQYAPLPART
jgi:hypothetical protein